MERRTFLTVSLALLLGLYIASVCVTPASAYMEPCIRIWKEFMDTSDPPPYELRTIYHWDIEIGVSTSVALTRARVNDRFGAELKMDSIRIPGRTYTFTYPNYHEEYPTEEATVTISGVGTCNLDREGVTFGTEPYKFHIYWSGKSHKIHFEWHIGSLEAGEITIIVGVSTDLNPGGKQQFTSPCEHCINSGATLRAKWGRRWISRGTEELCIKVACVPIPARLCLDKFNDINGNGIYDAGDVKIPDWPIDVTDPLGATTTYLTPAVVEITEFGTYTVREDLPAGWEQTAVRVDGVYKDPPTVEVTIVINEGESHDILYGNKVPPARLIIEKFNDLNGNGEFDGDDVMIITWEIYVTDPDGVTTTHSTPVSLDITLFGTYIITEDLPAFWEQTAVRVDDVYQDPPTLTVTVDVNAGEEHSVLYGNREIVPPHVEISLGIRPNIQYVGSDITFSWEIDSPPELTPVMVELKLIDPDGAETILYTGSTFPDDFTGSETWTATGPTGGWKARVIYYYTYLGYDLTAKATHSFIVLP